ncbi:30S ribosomal protein S1 [Parvibaculum indicum]|uniref:30S ribosomal protein S1 n=1 Tax=Parvibaculum indicum TaxID=562969 RepID=UPI001422112A|nr:30S ribosomal protein S1 [Parvibaculum indicum]
MFTCSRALPYDPGEDRRTQPSARNKKTIRRLNTLAEAMSAELNPSREDFAAMLEESFSESDMQEGNVVKGTIVAIENDLAIIDVGLKTEGRVPLKEFSTAGKPADLSVGSEVEVYLERIENAMGEAVLSREKAKREESWIRLEAAFEKNERVEGQIFGRVKGGFTVDLDGAVAFLPGSQVDIRPVRDVTPLMNIPQPFQILKMDKRRGNIVVSRRAVLEETRAEQRQELVENLKEGQVLEGVVKNITDYGAFVDLGGVDGLLHVTDIAWRRVNHPTEVLSIGQTVKVQVIKVNHDTQRISLGMKQLEADPWEGVEAKYPVNAKFKGRVTNITDYGAFVELEPGVEGLVHVSEMSWTKKNVHPGKIVSTSQEVEVMVLEVDPVKRRISLGLKQCMDNPWTTFADRYPPGTEVEGEIKNITEFGLFIGLEADVDGMVHMSDLDWNKSGEEAMAEYQKGQVVKAVVLDVDTEKERISLGIKQLGGDPLESLGDLRKGSVVTCTVTEVQDNGIEVSVGEEGVTAFIRRAELARDRADQRPDRFAVGDKLDARITQFDKTSRRMQLSVKALEIAEEKEAVEQYGSSDSGASLGDILGAALKAQDKE